MGIEAPKIVTICGGSASGKTTISHALQALLGREECQVVPLDSYYIEAGHMSFEERCLINFDHPDAFEFELLGDHLDRLLKGESVKIPHYDYSTHTRIPGRSIPIPPAPLILVEGILTLHPELLRNYYHEAIFVEAEDDIRYERRLYRDTRERGRTEESVKEQWENTVQPMYEMFCKPSASHATLRVSGTAPVESVCVDIFKHLGIEGKY